MNKIIAVALAAILAFYLYIQPREKYDDVVSAIENPYAASIVEQTGQLRGNLSEANRQLYDLLKKGLLERSDEILVRRKLGSEDDLWNVVRCIVYDTPEIFWVDWSNWNLRDVDEGFTVLPTYTVAASELEAQKSALDAAARVVLDAVTAYGAASNLDKALVTHDWLVLNVAYGDDAEASAHTLYGALVNKSAVCDGYAHAYHYLMQRLGVDCYYVEGTTTADSPDVGHAWNIVDTGEGFFSYVDCTWDDGDYEQQQYNNAKIPVVSRNYFFIGPEAISATHTPDAYFELPECREYDYFGRLGLSGSSFADIKNAAVLQLYYNILSGRNYVELRVTDQKEFDRILGINDYSGSEDTFSYAAGPLAEAVNDLLESNGNPLRVDDTSIYFSYDDVLKSIIFAYDAA